MLRDRVKEVINHSIINPYWLNAQAPVFSPEEHTVELGPCTKVMYHMVETDDRLYHRICVIWPKEWTLQDMAGTAGPEDLIQKCLTAFRLNWNTQAIPTVTMQPKPSRWRCLYVSNLHSFQQNGRTLLAANYIWPKRQNTTLF